MVSSTVLVSTHTTPTGMPPSRARPTTTVSAQGFKISSKEPVSKNPVWNCLVSGEQRGTHKHQHGSFLSFPGTQQLLVSHHYPLTSPYTSTIHSFSHHTHPPVIYFFSIYIHQSYISSPSHPTFILLHTHLLFIHFLAIHIHQPLTSIIQSFLLHYTLHSSSLLHPHPQLISSPSTSTTHHIFSTNIHHSACLLHPHLPITTSSLSTSTTHHLFSIHIHHSSPLLHPHPPLITSSPSTSTTHHLLSIHIHHSSPLVHPHPPLIISSPSTSSIHHLSLSTIHHIFSTNIHHSSCLLHPHPPLITSPSTSTTHHLFSIHIPKHAFPSSPLYWLMCELTGVKKLHTTGLLVSPRVLPGTLRPANIQRGS